MAKKKAAVKYKGPGIVGCFKSGEHASAAASHLRCAFQGLQRNFPGIYIDAMKDAAASLQSLAGTHGIHEKVRVEASEAANAVSKLFKNLTFGWDLDKARNGLTEVNGMVRRVKVLAGQKCGTGGR